MKLPHIINSLLETDMYKFSMGQTIFHQFTSYKTTWTFKCRNKDVHFSEEMVEEIRQQIAAFCGLRFTEEELDYLDNITWIKGSYVDFLRLWQPRYEEFTITTDAPCGLSIEAAGTWLNTTMYEIPILAIVNEVYFRMAYDYDELLEQFKTRLSQKVEMLEKNKYRLNTFSEFGLRRRLSAQAQEIAVEALTNLKDTDSKFIGTSNVYLAKKYNLKPIGTMAHEWIMCTGQGNHKHNPAYSNWYALDAWVKEYGILNGIALTDTITTDCFLRDFQLTYATLFSGVRHDSGDPYEWGEKMIAHYKKLGIDPRTKTLLFSDSLDFEKATQIYDHFKDKVQVAFGIGTFISNDTNVPALNIVMKTTKCNGMDVAKISDIVGKGMCKNPDYVDYLNRCIEYRMNNDD
ncbi:MAG: nicotinate phosphoribosyltransferase [Agathobacter sp.]|nr:nicotinate phosphoribosyltransferase [Lachnobacterium sp.]MDY6157026.1 nicotinate phosphoribosyltransferase [Agathobacter sp.]